MRRGAFLGGSFVVGHYISPHAFHYSTQLATMNSRVDLGDGLAPPVARSDDSPLAILRSSQNNQADNNNESSEGPEGTFKRISHLSSLTPSTTNSNVNDPEPLAVVSEMAESAGDSTSVQSDLSGGTPVQASRTLLAQKETRQIGWLKITALVAFVLATCFASVYIYLATKQSEQSQFQEAYSEQAFQVIDQFASNLLHTIGILDQFSVTISSLAAFTNTTWPFLTLPDFALRVASIQNLAKHANGVNFSPLVSQLQRQAWESYCLRLAQGWVSAGLSQEQNGMDYVDFNYRKLNEELVKFSSGVATQIYRMNNQSQNVVEGVSELK